MAEVNHSTRWRWVLVLELGYLLGCLAATPETFAASRLQWKILQPGVEYAVLEAPRDQSLPIDGQIHLVRIDPAQAPLEVAMAGPVMGVVGRPQNGATSTSSPSPSTWACTETTRGPTAAMRALPGT